MACLWPLPKSSQHTSIQHQQGHTPPARYGTPTLASADLAILVRDFPISHALLAHDGLMTPVLTRAFGAVHARQTDLDDAADSLVRQSTLFQTATGAPLLQARLVIHKPALPAGFLDRLLAGTQPFGALLIKAGLAVRMTDHHIFRTSKSAGAWGRRHRMVLAGDAAPLCDVEEWLEPEESLANLILPATRDRLTRP